jgi:hypothetical protein
LTSIHHKGIINPWKPETTRTKRGRLRPELQAKCTNYYLLLPVAFDSLVAVLVSWYIILFIVRPAAVVIIINKIINKNNIAWFLSTVQFQAPVFETCNFRVVVVFASETRIALKAA